MDQRDRTGLRFWIGCVLLALAARSVNFAPVFLQGDTRLIGTDPYYHVRRIHQIVRHFPRAPTFDPYLGHPFGALCPYETGFDLLLAATSRLLLGSSPTLLQVTTVCAAVMPLLGLLALPLYAAIGRWLGGVTASRISALLMAIVPGVVFSAQLGQVDHHVLEPLVVGAPMLAALVMLEAPDRRYALLVAGTALGAGVFFWRGMILPAGLLAAAFAIRGVWQAVYGLVDRLTRLEAPLLFGVAALTALPFGLASPVDDRLSYFTVSLLQPLVFALLGLSLLLMGQLCAWSSEIPSGRNRRWLDAHLRAGFVGALIIIAFLVPFVVVGALLPSFAPNMLSGLGFLARTGPFVQAVGEQRLLLTDDDGRFSLLYAVYFYGALYFAAPVLAWFAWRDGHLAGADRYRTAWIAPDFRWTLFVVWSVALAFLAFMQRRYAVLFAPLYCVWLGMGAAAAWERVKARGRRTQALIAAVTTLLVLPTLALIGAQAVAPVQEPALLEAMAWIRRHTPETSSFDLDAPGQAFVAPEYGVLAAWEEGHHLVALARRPNVANPFGIEWFKAGLERTARFWLAPGDRLAQAMDATGARFALVSFRLGLLRDEARFVGADPDRYALPAPDRWLPGPDFASTGAVRLFLEDGLAQRSLPPIDGVRLVWEGGAVVPGEPAAAVARVGAPAYKLFERVPGARLVCRLPPGSWVSVSTPVATQTGRRFEWRKTLKVPVDGRAVLSVPYASVGVPEGWARATGPLTVEAGGRRWLGRVTEVEVRAGIVSDLESLR